jgi:hypothetical protein
MGKRASLDSSDRLVDLECLGDRNSERSTFLAVPFADIVFQTAK